METRSILLTCEGTYPSYHGGVSVWCDKLIRGLPQHKFHVFAITHNPSQPIVFPSPDNVVSRQILPLWGTEEPGAEDELFSETYRRKIRTSHAAIRDHFLEPFAGALECILQPDGDPEQLAWCFLRLHTYFREFDFARSAGSSEAWDTFLLAYSKHCRQFGELSVQEATDCMRWLQRYLSVLSVQYPRVDITHASMAGLPAIPGVLLKLLNGSRFVLTEHGIYLRELYIALGRSEYTERCKRFLLAFSEAVVRMNYHFADAVTCLCDFNKGWQIRLGADVSKIHITPNGVDPEIFFPGPGCKRQNPTVLTMSRIMPLKGTEVLIRAAVIVRSMLPNVKFRILGERAEGAYVEKCVKLIAEHRLADTIEIGQTSDSAAAYRDTHVFCLPSISEAMPYSVIEAMFSGCPIVATDVGGVPELLADTGVLVKPNDPDGLAAALLPLLDGTRCVERRQALASSALARASEQFTLRRATGRFLHLYEELTREEADNTYAAEMPGPATKRTSLAAIRRS